MSIPKRSLRGAVAASAVALMAATTTTAALAATAPKLHIRAATLTRVAPTTWRGAASSPQLGNGQLTLTGARDLPADPERRSEARSAALSRDLRPGLAAWLHRQQRVPAAWESAGLGRPRTDHEHVVVAAPLPRRARARRRPDARQ